MKVQTLLLRVLAGVLVLVVLLAGAVTGYNQWLIRDSVSKMKQLLIKDLADPDSAKLRSVRLLSLGGGKLEEIGDFARGAGGPLTFENLKSVLFYEPRLLQLCGEINAKNRFGAYVGYKEFWVTSPVGGNVFISEREGDTVAKALCATPMPVVWTEG